MTTMSFVDWCRARGLAHTPEIYLNYSELLAEKTRLLDIPPNRKTAYDVARLKIVYWCLEILDS